MCQNWKTTSILILILYKTGQSTDEDATEEEAHGEEAREGVVEILLHEVESC